jgi:hypothetical protein
MGTCQGIDLRWIGERVELFKRACDFGMDDPEAVCGWQMKEDRMVSIIWNAE